MRDMSRRFVFISSNIGWGGSEDLWSGAAAMLAERGHKVTACKAGFERGEPLPDRLRALYQADASLELHAAAAGLSAVLELPVRAMLEDA